MLIRVIETQANEPHTYNMIDQDWAILAGTHSQVTYNPSLPPPDPRYLALHAACAKVAFMSGTAEHIDPRLSTSEGTNGREPGSRPFTLRICPCQILYSDLLSIFWLHRHHSSNVTECLTEVGKCTQNQGACELLVEV